MQRIEKLKITTVQNRGTEGMSSAPESMLGWICSLTLYFVRTTVSCFVCVSYTVRV